MIRFIHNQFPNRIVVAWAIIGAASGLSVRFFPATFKGRIENHGRGVTVKPDPRAVGSSQIDHYPFAPQTEHCEVRAFGSRVIDEEVPVGTGSEIVGRWQLGLTAFLALVGACIGASIGAIRWWSAAPPAFQGIGYRLISPALTYAGLLLLGLPGGSDGPLFYRTIDPLAVKPTLAKASAAIVGSAGEALLLSIPALIIGWAHHKTVAAWGFRIPRLPLPDQAADYDDLTRLPTAE